MKALTAAGRTVFAATGGVAPAPGRPTAILVHGAGGDQSVWSQQARYMAHHGANVLALDLPGHGRSDGPAFATIEDVAEFLTAFVAAHGGERPVLIGHSLGALAALEAAGRLGGDLAGLALCGCAARMPVHPDLLAAAGANPAHAAAMIASWGHGPRAHIGGNPAHGLSAVGTARRLIARTPADVLHADLAACDAYADAEAAAARVACPTRFVLGGRDRMTPPKGARPLIEAIAGADTVTIPESGHMMMAEAPHAAREALMGLLRRVTDAAEGAA